MSTDVKGNSEAGEGPGWRGGAAMGHKARPTSPSTLMRGSVPGFKGIVLAAVRRGQTWVGVRETSVEMGRYMGEGPSLPHSQAPVSSQERLPSATFPDVTPGSGLVLA